MNVPSFTRLHPRLPIFAVPLPDAVGLYVPGYVQSVDAAQCAALAEIWNGRALPGDAATAALAANAERRAEELLSVWSRIVEHPFVPECLTIYLGNRCTCGCVYCYVEPDRKRAQPRANAQIDPSSVEAAARLVADACALRRRPLHVVVHGGGEPTAYWPLLQRITAATKSAASDAGVEWRGHLATNGIVSAARAAWIASEFNSASVSHDGPPDIHDRQRPLRNGQPSSAVVERTLAALLSAGMRVGVRTTILPAAAARQREIVEYLTGRLGARDVRFEPVYRASGMPGCGFADKDADRFVQHFIDAEARARELGTSLSIAGIRPRELHGPYCDALRSVLHVVPGGVATACFFATDRESAIRAGAVIGEWDGDKGHWNLDFPRRADHARRAAAMPVACADCLCACHCVKGCPDVCRASAGIDVPPPPFRCRVWQLLAVQWIRRACESLPANAAPTAMHPIILS